MPRVARLGDPGSHGGTIVTGAASVRSDGHLVARIGDTYACPLHGPNPIVEGSAHYRAEGSPVARVGDAMQCGAVVQDGSPKFRDSD